MTVRTEPTHGDPNQKRDIDSLRLAEAIANSAASYIVPTGTDLLVSADAELSGDPLQGFAEANRSGRTLTVDTGEATFGGHYVASDDTTVTDSVTGNNVHDATIPENRNNETVYLAVDRTRTDRIIIDIDENINLSSVHAPRVSLFDVSTDSSSITNVTNQRNTKPTLDLRNARYEGPESQPVDEANKAQFLRGLQPDQFVRSDEDDTLTGVYLFTPGGGSNGVPGEGSGEKLRVASGTSDFLHTQQGGNGRVALTWNAYYDGSNGVWRCIVANEEATMLGLSNRNPSGASGGGVVRAVASPKSNADAELSWQTRTLDDNGDLYINGERMQTIPVRSTDPSDSNIPNDQAAIYFKN